MGIKLKTIYLPSNTGHGNARRKSLEYSENEIVALMDADDISYPDRFEKQLVLMQNENIDIVGGQITEFIDNPSNIIGKREVPESDSDIKKYMKKRCPMNQVSVMFKKSVIQKAGGYIDWYCEEDYFLWIRLTKIGAIFANLPDILVNVRIGNEMSARRGGWKYFLSEAKLQVYMLKERIISFPRFLYNIVIRFGGEILIDKKMRTMLYKRLHNQHYKDFNNVRCKEIIDQNRKLPPFSVAMCVYGGDNPEWFDLAMKSIIDQTIKPSEIILVVDGSIPLSIQAKIDNYSQICNCSIV